jgi:predicted SAM-dependent methyltransferase
MSCRNVLKQWLTESNPDLLRLLRLLRYESKGWYLRVRAKMLPRHRATVKALRDRRNLFVNLASGVRRLSGWVNVDASLEADLPFSDESVELLFCEHFLDHLEYPAGARSFLSECLRVLKAGGRARFVLHDALELCRAYAMRDVTYFERGGEMAPTLAEAVNKLFRYNGFHQFLYDFETLERMLCQVGFIEIVRSDYGVGCDPRLVQDSPDASRPVLSMYVECIRPSSVFVR